MTLWPSAVRDALNLGITSEPESPGFARSQREQSPGRGRTENTSAALLSPRLPRDIQRTQGHARSSSSSSVGDFVKRGRDYVQDLLRQGPGVVPSALAPKSRSKSRSNSREPTRGRVPSASSRVDLFQDAISSLEHIEEFEVNWYVDHGLREHFNSKTGTRNGSKGSATRAWTFPFFPLIWNTIAPNLRKLTLDVQMFIFADVVLASRGNVEALGLRLDELNLTLRNTTNAYTDSPPANFNDVSTIIPYFINNLSLTLRTLSLRTIGHVSLSYSPSATSDFEFFPFFQLVGPLPLLTKLSLYLPFDEIHLPRSGSDAYRRFLHAHPKIEQLCVRYVGCEKCQRFGAKRAVGNTEGEESRYQAGLYDGITIPALRSLELGLSLPGLIPPPSSSSSSPVDLSYSFSHNSLYPPPVSAISRLPHPGVLTSLTLTDRSIPLSVLRTLFRSFHGCSRLRKLKMFAKILSPQLVDLVAMSCPVLSIWEVDVQGAVKWEDAAEVGVLTDAGLGGEKIEDDVVRRLVIWSFMTALITPAF